MTNNAAVVRNSANEQNTLIDGKHIYIRFHSKLRSNTKVSFANFTKF